MGKIILLVLYMIKGEVVLEQKPQPSLEICDKNANKRVAELLKDPSVDLVITAGCAAGNAREAKN